MEQGKCRALQVKTKCHPPHRIHAERYGEWWGFMESGKCTHSNDYNLFMREFGETAVPTCSWHEKCRS